MAVAAVIIWATRQAPPSLPSGPSELVALISAIAFVALATALRSERWLMLLRRDGGDPTRGDVYGIYAVGFMGNTALPARGGDVFRVYLMSPRSGLGLRSVIGTLIAERLLDVVFLLTVFAVLGYFVLRGVDVPDSRYLLLGIATAVLALVVTGFVLRRHRDRPWARRVIDFVEPMLVATRQLRGRHAAEMIAITAATWAAETGVYLLTAASVGLEIDPLEALYVIGVASVFLLIPSGPGYAGTLDAAIAFGARAVGASGGQAVSFLIMLRVVLFLPLTIAGLIAYLVRYRIRPGGSPVGDPELS